MTTPSSTSVSPLASATAGGHPQDHARNHPSHGGGHVHADAPAQVGRSPEPAHSLLMAGALPRMAGALAVVALLWLAVAWATGSVA